MNYELTKKLIDAKFPFRDLDFGHLVDFEKLNKQFPNAPLEALVKFPTLSELIEACVESDKYEFRFELCDFDGWTANMDVGGDEIIRAKGNYATPEEAVANLWLELKKK